MNRLVILFVSLAVAEASVVQFPATLYSVPVATQFHNQDSLGQYSFGYSGGPSAKSEYKTLDGVIRGSYSYVDTDGKLQTVEYTADGENGFQASATNLPVAPVDDRSPPKPVEDTPEVAKAKAEHFAAVREAEQRADQDSISGDDSGESQPDQNGSQIESESRTEPMEPGTTESSLIADNGNGTGNGIENNSVLATAQNSSSSSSVSPLALGSPLPPIGLNSFQFNGGLASDTAFRFSDITPATTTELRPIPLDTSYLRVSTPTHGYSIYSPTVLTAVPTLRATSSQTISRPLPIPLTPNFLTQGLI